MTREEVNDLYDSPGSDDWRGAKFQMGRAPFDAKYFSVWRALFESFAPAERALAPVYRFLIRSRVATLRGDTAPDPSDVRTMAFETALSTLNLGALSLELEALLRSYVADILEFVVSIIGQRDELVGPSSRLEPIGVFAGMVFAMVTSASCGARLKRFQFLDWWEVPRMLRGRPPSSREVKAPSKGRIGFDDLVDKGVFERMRALIPAQPSDKYRVWGVKSFAVLPMFGGVYREDVAQQYGYRTPVSLRRERGTRSGLRSAVADPDATLAAPGVASYEKDAAAGRV